MKTAETRSARICRISPATWAAEGWAFGDDALWRQHPHPVAGGEIAEGRMAGDHHPALRGHPVARLVPHPGIERGQAGDSRPPPPPDRRRPKGGGGEAGGDGGGIGPCQPHILPGMRIGRGRAVAVAGRPAGGVMPSVAVTSGPAIAGASQQPVQPGLEAEPVANHQAGAPIAPASEGRGWNRCASVSGPARTRSATRSPASWRTMSPRMEKEATTTGLGWAAEGWAAKVGPRRAGRSARQLRRAGRRGGKERMAYRYIITLNLAHTSRHRHRTAAVVALPHLPRWRSGASGRYRKS